MRITLFANKKIHEYFLPSQISGSYSFDPDLNEDFKLLNIEAVNNQWVIYAKNGLSIFHDNKGVEEIALVPNEFYILKKDGQSFLLLTSPLFEDNIKVYQYFDNIRLSIGSNNCNVLYNCPYANGSNIEIRKDNGVLTLFNSPGSLTYVNNNKVEGQSCYILNGSTVNFYGLKLMFLPNTLIINNPYKGISINDVSANIRELVHESQKYKDLEIKDVDLYSKDEYFSKSPRIRRLVEEVELSIDKPPKNEKPEELPALLTFGPTLTMAAMSGMTLLNTITQVSSGNTPISSAWPTILSGVLMLGTSLVWPYLTKEFNKHIARDSRIKTTKLYTEYLATKEAELKKELVLQKNIWEENLLPVSECLKIINTRKNNFWCKRVDQGDFLTVRVGVGQVPLKVNVHWPEDGFTIEEDKLKAMADDVVNTYKYIDNCPMAYSFYENFLTAVMGVERKCYGLVNNVLLQLMTFYCYDELKIVVFTNSINEYRWDFLKYSNYCFPNDKSVRFFASNIDEGKELGNYLLQELNYKLDFLENSQGGILPPQKPHYLILCDDYSTYKKNEFFKVLTELDNQIGYSTIIIENKLDRLPSKCINFINMNEGQSGILKNSYEQAEIINFHDEINQNINMFEITKILSNIPIEIEGAAAKLPDAIEFLEMEKVGKVEQLNILNRWNTNDSTKSLRAEIGVDETEDYLYLDLHEKFHGPHGLIAGTTGSGKSEFIITYILSMAINYSPDDIAFILIDYKGGGLAYAFENKLTGVKLPHLAGTITNLDKSEMHRTLVSIDSEVKRRQAEFNKARDLLGESTIDIYKYQNFYHEGKLKEPIPHLFLIADEFAELKSQQPEFMDNLISVARIGRSLGVHLILATQKPSGVVDEQIWSNTKFRVCLKVADTSDSNEMIKKPDAALLKQSGRFYLQVGMDEIFELGQSGWAGAKYYPSDNIVKQVDKSITFIDNGGQVIKRISENSSSANKKEAQGEQLAAIMNEIIKVAEQTKKHVRRLWLDNVPAIVLVDKLEDKYQVKHNLYNVTGVVGEYDAPELQKQGIVVHDFLEAGNTIIYGTEGGEREQLLNTLIYSSCKNHNSDELNIYAIDYGSESLRMFNSIPHFGGVVFNGEGEKFNNLLKLINEEVKSRKKLFVDFGGDYKNYIKNSGNKLPLKVIIFNNYDAIYESHPELYDLASELFRDSERYGVIYLLTCTSSRSITSKVQENFNKVYALKLKETFEYSDVLGTKVVQGPADLEGRGIINIEGAHEFQTASLVEDDANLSKFLIDFTTSFKNSNQIKAKKIPTLPDHVLLEDVQESIKDISCVPVGIYRANLSVCTMDFTEMIGSVITANKIGSTVGIVKSLLTVFKSMKYGSILIDGTKTLNTEKSKVSNYFDDKFDDVLTKINEVVDKLLSNEINTNMVIFLYGVDKFISKLDDASQFGELITKLKKIEKVPFIMIEDATKLKKFQYEDWYQTLYANPEGVWVGTGIGDQSLFRISGYSKEQSYEYPNNMGFYVVDGIPKLIKLLEFEKGDEDE